ncbi:MAG: serine hydrolase domain-containing protein [Planctomycetaceae bacterium]
MGTGSNPCANASSDNRSLLEPAAWRRVMQRAEQLCAHGDFPALALEVHRGGRRTGVRTFGRVQPESGAALPEDAIFLVASLTKPIVAMAALLLVERGQLSLMDRVVDYVPEFSGADRKSITVRNLLTHTSGLPDMLPNNRALRERQSPLSGFVTGTCGVTLDFPVGRGVQYQSMGFALLGQIISQLSGMTYGEFLQREFFEPLGMQDTALSPTVEWLRAPVRASRLTTNRLPPDQVGQESWNWNSDYWRTLGAPWGGMLTTVHDLGRYCRMMLGEGTLSGVRVLSPATVRAATTNQLDCLHDVPEADRRTRPWGFGWRLNWPAHSTVFCDLLPPDAFGHWGATGTLFWMDRRSDTAAILLSTQPLDMGSSGELTRLSNMIAAGL